MVRREVRTGLGVRESREAYARRQYGEWSDVTFIKQVTHKRLAVSHGPLGRTGRGRRRDGDNPAHTTQTEGRQDPAEALREFSLALVCAPSSRNLYSSSSEDPQATPVHPRRQHSPLGPRCLSLSLWVGGGEGGATHIARNAPQREIIAAREPHDAVSGGP